MECSYVIFSLFVFQLSDIGALCHKGRKKFGKVTFKFLVTFFKHIGCCCFFCVISHLWQVTDILECIYASKAYSDSATLHFSLIYSTPSD